MTVGRIPRSLGGLVDWFANRPTRLTAAALLAALGLSLPSLGVGYLLDDHVHRYALRGLPGPARGLNLFDFTSNSSADLGSYIAHGPYPWWTNPELKVRFFRPLASALMQLEHAVAPDSAPVAHLHSVVWGVLLLLAAQRVLRRVLPGPLGGLALCMFAVAESHWMPVAWIANRNALVAGVFGLTGFWLHLRWREPLSPEGARWPWVVGSTSSFALGLCAGEAGLGMLALPVAWELVRSVGSIRSRGLALLPVGVVLIGYVLAYWAGGFGALGSGVYIDPSRSPVAWLKEAPVRLVVLVGSLLANAPADLWMSAPRARAFIVAESALALVVAGWLVVRLLRRATQEERRLVGFLVLASLLAIVPTVSTFPMARLVLPASLSACALVALLARSLWLPPTRWLAALLLVVHLVLPPLYWLGSTLGAIYIGRSASLAARTMELGGDWASLRVVALSAPDPATFLYLPLERSVEVGTRPRTWWTLTQVRFPLELLRVSDSAFELQVVGGRLLDGVYEQVVRSMAEPYSVGDRVELSGAAVVVVAVDDGYPTRLRFELDGSLDQPDVRVMAWKGGTYRKVDLPPVGERLLVPFEPGPMGP